MIVLGVLTDGRADCLSAGMETVHHLGSFDRQFIVDDSADPDYASWLRCNYPGFRVFRNPSRLGLARAVQEVWTRALDEGADYLFHLEDDFEILTDIDVAAMVETLDSNCGVAQMLLKRQPLSAPEVNKDDVLGGMHHIDTHVGWVTQRHIFSLNPCVIPRWVLELGWPAGNEAEMTQRLLGFGARFGVWGDPGSRPLVHHIGEVRSPAWML